MKTFNEIKKKFVQKCKEKKACAPEFKKLLVSSNEQQLWEVLLSNYRWCNDNDIFHERPATFEFTEIFEGSLDVIGCDLKGVTLPTGVRTIT